MKQHITNSVSAIALSAMMFSGVALTGVFVSAEPVFAKSANANNGNRGESGNRGNNGNRGNSEARGGNNGGNNNHGASASGLGALNAGHANQNAFLNASSNSRVGLIRTYMEAVGELEDATATYDDALAALAAFDEFETGFDTYEDFLAAYEGDPTGLDEEAGYWGAVVAVVDAVDGLEGLEEAADGALDAAANKEVTEQVVDDLWVLLDGIDLDAGTEEAEVTE